MEWLATAAQIKLYNMMLAGYMTIMFILNAYVIAATRGLARRTFMCMDTTSDLWVTQAVLKSLTVTEMAK
jgi:hypothetical protein